MINTSNYEAMIFDMDGTLVDTELSGDDVIHNLQNKFSVKFTEKDWDVFNSVWHLGDPKMTTDTCLEYILQPYLSENLVTDFIKEFHKGYESAISMANPLPGANELISSLKGVIKTALVSRSSAKQVGIVLKSKHWNRFFDIIITGTDVINGKPNPEPYLKASEKLNIEPTNCLVVENSGIGCESAKQAGMEVVGVQAGNNPIQDLSKCDYIFNTLEEFKKILK